MRYWQSMKSASILSVLLATAAWVAAEPEMPKRGVVMEVWDNVKIGRMEDFLAVMKQAASMASG